MPVRGGRRPARRTATGGWPIAGRRRCCTSARAWATGWPTCTTRGAPHSAGRRRRRSRHLPQAVRRATRVRHRDARPARCRPGSAARRAAEDVAADAADAVAAAYGPPGQIATLILPADVSWSEGGRACARRSAGGSPAARSAALDEAASALRSGENVRAPARGQRAPAARPARRLSRIAQATGAGCPLRDVPGAARARRGHPGDRPAAPTSPRSPSGSWTARGT